MQHSSQILETCGRSLSGGFNFVSTSEECRVVQRPEERRGEKGTEGKSEIEERVPSGSAVARRFRYLRHRAVGGDGGDFKGRIRLPPTRLNHRRRRRRCPRASRGIISDVAFPAYACPGNPSVRDAHEGRKLDVISRPRPPCASASSGTNLLKSEEERI